MAWVQLPFPACPSCGKEWVSSRHRDCAKNGEVELDPDARLARCDSCSRRWSLSRTTFYCTCDRVFSPAEVESAMSELVRAAQLLARLMEQNEADLRDIRKVGEVSMRGWLMKLVDTVAATAGRALGAFMGSLVRSMFGRT